MGSDLNLPSVTGPDCRAATGGGLYSIHHGGDGKRTRMHLRISGCDSAESNPVISTRRLAQAQGRARRAADGFRSTFRYAVEEVGRAVLDRRRCWQALQLLLWKRCGVMPKPCRVRPRQDGRRVDGSLMSARALRCCTARLPGLGPSTTLAASVGLSRRPGRTRFIQLIGAPLMHDLRSRMQVAARNSATPARPGAGCGPGRRRSSKRRLFTRI